MWFGAFPCVNVWLNLVSQTENPHANTPDQEAELSRIPVFSFETPPSYHPLPGDKLYFFYPIGAGVLCSVVGLTVEILKALWKAVLELGKGPGPLPEFPLFNP